MKVFYILADEMRVKKRIDLEKFEIGTYSRLFILEISDRQKGSERKKLYVGYLDTCNKKKNTGIIVTRLRVGLLHSLESTRRKICQLKKNSGLSTTTINRLDQTIGSSQRAQN